MDDRFDDKWRSDIVEAYFDDKPAPLQRTMLTAPPLEKTDSQLSPMSSGLVTPQDSWTFSTPDRRRSGRFSMDYGQSNRWSLGTQLSNVSFPECIFTLSETDGSADEL